MAEDNPDSMESSQVAQRVLQTAARRLQCRRDRAAFVIAQFAELQQPVDEQPQPKIGRQPAGGGMRCIQQPRVRQIRHHVADRRGREVHRQAARQSAAADRLPGFDVLLDDLPQHGGGPRIEALAAKALDGR